jgi:hypothetical protein
LVSEGRGDAQRARGRTECGKGPMRESWAECGKSWAGSGKKERKRAEVYVWAGFWFSYFTFVFHFLFQTNSNLFEFKQNFEFKPYAFKQNKTMHQHECNNKFKPRKILITL